MVISSEIRHMASDGISSGSRKNLALQIKYGIGDELTSVIGIDYGGKGQFEQLERYLERAGFNNYQYAGTLLPHWKLDPENKFRPILPEISEFRKIENAKNLLLFDDWSTRGKSWVGALYFVLKNIEQFGVDYVFIGVDRDKTGGTHFAGARIHKFIGVPAFLKKSSGDVYKELESEDRLKFIGYVPPEIANLGYVNIRGERKAHNDYLLRRVFI